MEKPEECPVTCSGLYADVRTTTRNFANLIAEITSEYLEYKQGISRYISFDENKPDDDYSKLTKNIKFKLFF